MPAIKPAFDDRGYFFRHSSQNSPRSWETGFCAGAVAGSGAVAGAVAGSGSVAGAASGGPFLVGRPGHWWAARESAHTLRVDTPPLRWIDPPEGPAIALLDQTRLPAAESIVTCGDVPALVDAIRRLVVRGAPMLGGAGAFGVAP